MEDKGEILRCYEKMLPLTEKMVELARIGDWDAMSRVEMQFRACVDQLKAMEQNQDLSQEQLNYKKLMLDKILADDAEIRRFATPQLAHLGELIGNLRQRQNLNQAYGF